MHAIGRFGERAPASEAYRRRLAIRQFERLAWRADRILRLGRTETVGELLDRAMALATTARQQAAVLALNARLHTSEARLEEAARFAKRAVAVFQALGDESAGISVRTHFAQLLIATGNTSEGLVEALGSMDRAQRIVDRATRLPILVECLRALAHVYIELDRHAESIAYGERGIELARELGDRTAEGALRDTIGCAYGAMAYDASAAGDHGRASELTERSIEFSLEAVGLARSSGHRRYEATALANAAEGFVQLGRPEAALALMSEWPTDPPALMVTLASHRLDTEGTICLALGRTAEAVARFEAAAKAATTTGLELVAYEHLAEACERNGDLVAALAHQKRAYALYKRVASEASQRSASVAAVHLEAHETRATLDEHRAMAAGLQRSNEQLNRRADDLLRLSHHDPLTGLANRRRMETLLEGAPSAFGIIMIDVDHFKSINDGWSHVVGDAVLERIARVLGRCCRASDTAVRYGGDEFAILVELGDDGTTTSIAERVRADVEAYDWNEVARGLTVSVSVGCSSLADASAATAFESADRRLYEAKRAGRNRVAAS